MIGSNVKMGYFAQHSMDLLVNEVAPRLEDAGEAVAA